MNCPLPADSFEEGEIGPWKIRIYYCSEHRRERENGTPMGGLGIDGSRVMFTPTEESMPLPGGLLAISPQ
jgi:hypothetical protein